MLIGMDEPMKHMDYPMISGLGLTQKNKKAASEEPTPLYKLQLLQAPLRTSGRHIRRQLEEGLRRKRSARLSVDGRGIIIGD
jgi:hypothetical protein